MNTNILTLASSLSDHDLLARVVVLAAKEREASAELVAHLAALDARPALYAAEGHGSLFTYCTDVLRLSEDAACNRIQAARACRDFPMIRDLLGSGAMSLTSVRMLRPHLPTENHEAQLARANARAGDRERFAGALPCPVHDRQGEPRQATARPGPSPPRDPGWRPGRDLRPGPHPAPREGREGEAWGGGEAAATAYPPRGG